MEISKAVKLLEQTEAQNTKNFTGSNQSRNEGKCEPFFAGIDITPIEKNEETSEQIKEIEESIEDKEITEEGRCRRGLKVIHTGTRGKPRRLHIYFR